MEKKILTAKKVSQSSPFNQNENQSSPFSNKDAFIPIVSSLDDDESNFVFSFGESQIGKSVILASVLFYMNARAGSIRPKLSTPLTKEAEVMLYDMMDNLKKGILPPRNVVEQVTRLDLVFQPNNKSKKIKPISLTFLEMSGEDLQKVRRGGSFHKSIDEYLNAEIPITFFLVTDYDNAFENDSLIMSFLRKLESERRRYKKVNAILIVTKWDKSGSMRPRSEEEFNAFIRDRMHETSNQIDQYELYKTYYTVGEVVKDKDGNDRLTQLNLETAKNLTEWLYESITGVDLNDEGTFWQRLFGK